jgi:hypothetical protein
MNKRQKVPHCDGSLNFIKEALGRNDEMHDPNLPVQ